MSYTIAEIRSKINEWDKDLTKNEKRYIHFHLFSNFLYYYNRLPNDRVKQQILNIFVDYIVFVESKDFHLSKEESRDLADTFRRRRCSIIIPQASINPRTRRRLVSDQRPT